jgi:hypothetical protein
MRIIFSRKGFDSSFGGKPSPILPDGRMVSLPIPAKKKSSTRYEDIRWQEYDLGTLVSDLTGGRIQASHLAHLDPDINRESIPRHSEWLPIFGQRGAAQGHLQKNHVQAGDIFLFFGLFRNVIETAGKFAWDTRAPKRHVLWGWLQIDEVLKVDDLKEDICTPARYGWAKYHPHFQWNPDASNTLYVARRYLTLPGVAAGVLDGAGVFRRFSKQLMLTDSDSAKPSQWELPQWFYPRDGKYSLTYHRNMARWQRKENFTTLKAVARGQEFLLDTNDFPEAIEWLKRLLEDTMTDSANNRNDSDW